VETLDKYLSAVQEADSSLPMLLSPPTWVAWRRLGEATKECQEKCQGIKLASTKGLCIASCQADEAVKRIAMLRSALTACGRSKNPDKCREKINEQIERWTEKLKLIRIRVAKLRVRAAKERA